MRRLSSEPLPKTHEGDTLHRVSQMPGFPQEKVHGDKSSGSTRSKLLKAAEDFIKERIKNGLKHSAFLLGQLYFEEEWYDDALAQFRRIQDKDFQALYQAGVMYYDGLGTPEDHRRGVEYMLKIANSSRRDAEHLRYAAAYNLGRACYQGFGMRRSDEEAEKWWLIAADDGNSKASVMAQSALGMFYSDPAHKNLKRSFFWHSEACGNGNLESQGVLGMMYLHGKGVKKSLEKAREYLKEAAERGSVYAKGQMVGFYYRNKMYTLAVKLAKQVVLYKDIDNIATTTECLPEFITKGISMANFYLARCLERGVGVQQDPAAAKKYYRKACSLDKEVAADLHHDIIYGKI